MVIQQMLKIKMKVNQKSIEKKFKDAINNTLYGRLKENLSNDEYKELLDSGIFFKIEINFQDNESIIPEVKSLKWETKTTLNDILKEKIKVILNSK